MLNTFYILVAFLKLLSPIHSTETTAMIATPTTKDCQIFMLTTCPPASTEDQFAYNQQAYCQGVKANVDCVNNMLKNCSYIDEYFQAMKTLKLIYQFTVQQATNHGCANITDRIILPGDDILKFKPTTTTTTTTTGPIDKKTAVNYVDPDCLRNLTNIECEKLEPHILRFILDDTNIDNDSCTKLISYTDCVQKKFSGECLVKFDKTVTQLQRINRTCGLKVVNVVGSDSSNKAPSSSDTSAKKFLIIVYVLLSLYSKVFD